MADIERERDKLIQLDFQHAVRAEIGVGNWINVCSFPADGPAIYGGLVSPSNRERVLSDSAWDIQYGAGVPGFVSYNREHGWEHSYDRFGDPERPVEPFIRARTFHGVKPAKQEVSEEFRLFHNLWEDPVSGNLFAITQAGNLDSVVEFRDGSIWVRLLWLRQYLAARNMLLVLYFESRAWSPEPLDRLGLTAGEREAVEGALRYVTIVAPWTFSEKGRSFCRILGKKLVAGVAREEVVPTLGTRGGVFEEFIVGVPYVPMSGARGRSSQLVSRAGRTKPCGSPRT